MSCYKMRQFAEYTENRKKSRSEKDGGDKQEISVFFELIENIKL